MFHTRGKRQVHKFSSESLERRGHLGDFAVGGKLMLQRRSEIELEGMAGIRRFRVGSSGGLLETQC
jgi:hypothetical protein